MGIDKTSRRRKQREQVGRWSETTTPYCCLVWIVNCESECTVVQVRVLFFFAPSPCTTIQIRTLQHYCSFTTPLLFFTFPIPLPLNLSHPFFLLCLKIGQNTRFLLHSQTSLTCFLKKILRSLLSILFSIS